MNFFQCQVLPREGEAITGLFWGRESNCFLHSLSAHLIHPSSDPSLPLNSETPDTPIHAPS